MKKRNLVVIGVIAAMMAMSIGCGQNTDKAAADASSMAESAMADVSSMAESAGVSLSPEAASMAESAMADASSMAESAMAGDTTMAEMAESSMAMDDNMEKNMLKGTISEIKDMQFVLEAEDKKAYVFSFDKKPEGLDAVKDGMMVEVTYTGEVSEVDPFKGEVVSVKEVK